MKGCVIKGEQYALVVLRITEWDAHGRPSKATIGYDDTTFRLDDGTPNEFLTAFVKQDCVQPRTRNN